MVFIRSVAASRFQTWTLQSQKECQVPWRHGQSGTFRPFSVQTGMHRLYDEGHMRNVTQMSASQLHLPDPSDLLWPLQMAEQHNTQILAWPWHRLPSSKTQTQNIKCLWYNSRNSIMQDGTRRSNPRWATQSNSNIWLSKQIWKATTQISVFDSRWAGIHTQIINSFSGMEKIKPGYGMSNVMAVNIMLKLARGILTQLIYCSNFF